MTDKKVAMDFDRDKAVEIAGGQFDLVLMAATRARQLRKGSTPKLDTGHREVTAALIEVQEGLYTREDFLSNMAGKKTKDEIEQEKLELEQQEKDNDKSI